MNEWMNIGKVPPRLGMTDVGKLMTERNTKIANLATPKSYY